jgi:hypothetical protein
MRRLLFFLWPAAALLAACAGGGAPAAPAPSGPSGSLGVMTAAAGAETVAALCDLRDATARDAANATFFDRAHQHLHVLAAATENVDRVPAAGVLETMQVVEADLLSDRLPAGFSDHVGALLTSTRTALEADGLPAPGC